MKWWSKLVWLYQIILEKLIFGLKKPGYSSSINVEAHIYCGHCATYNCWSDIRNGGVQLLICDTLQIILLKQNDTFAGNLCPSYLKKRYACLVNQVTKNMGLLFWPIAGDFSQWAWVKTFGGKDLQCPGTYAWRNFWLYRININNTIVVAKEVVVVQRDSNNLVMLLKVKMWFTFLAGALLNSAIISLQFLFRRLTVSFFGHLATHGGNFFDFFDRSGRYCWCWYLGWKLIEFWYDDNFG